MSKNKLLAYLIIFGGVVFFLIFAYTMWQVGRVVNYKMSYQSMVEQTIKEHVKEECLIK